MCVLCSAICLPRVLRSHLTIFGFMHLALQALLCPRPPPLTPLFPFSLAAQSGWFPLHIAARYGHVEVVEALLEKGAATEAKDRVRQFARTLFLRIRACVFRCAHARPPLSSAPDGCAMRRMWVGAASAEVGWAMCHH